MEEKKLGWQSYSLSLLGKERVLQITAIGYKLGSY
jgi:hypothetical protein